MTTVPTEMSTRYGHLTGDYVFDADHSRLGFTARHAMLTKVRGQFEVFEGHLRIEGDQPEQSTVTVTVDVGSISTGNAARDEHLRSSDFLAAETYPKMTFTSTHVRQIAEARFEVTGDLTIRGVKKPVSFEIHYAGSSTDPWGVDRLVFQGELTINRKEWGVSWNAALDAGAVLVSENVDIELEISAVQST